MGLATQQRRHAHPKRLLQALNPATPSSTTTEEDVYNDEENFS
jgi:hypothetical protein